MTEYISCIQCGIPRENQNTAEERRTPCAKCGATGLSINIELADEVIVHDDLAYKQKRGNKLITKGKIGTELHHDTNTWQYRERHYNLEQPEAEHSYTEFIENETTGIVIKKDEKLIDHLGRGSDRPDWKPKI